MAKENLNTATWNSAQNEKVIKTIATKLKDRNQRILRSGLITFVSIFILLAWGLILHQLDKNKTSLLDSLKREQKNLTSVLAENLFQTLEQKQAIELFALKWFSDHQQKPLNDITSFLYGERTFTRVVLYELSGKSFYQSSPNHQKKKHIVNIKTYIDKIVATGEPLFIYQNNDSLETSWQIHFLLPLKQGNTIQGAMLLELDIGYLLNLLHDINIGRTGKITIFSGQGKELACFANGGLTIGNPPSLGKNSLIASLHNFSGSGIFQYPGLGYYHIAYLHVRNYPFIITVSQQLDDFFADFTQHRKKLLLILTIITLFCFIGVSILLKMINRNNHYLNALSIAHEKNKELIAKLEQEHQAATKAASFDSLTQLYNRRLFISMAQKNLFMAKRNKFSYAVLFIDLDRFKTINDTLGHRIGDLLLKKVAERLSACTRRSDIVARFGGDEFVVMITEMSKEQNIANIAEKIIRVISKPCKNLGGHHIITSPSIGIALYPRDGGDIGTLIRNADAAMYKSKNSGRGRYSFFDTGLNKISIQKFELEQRMPSAIANGEFVLHYQPKIRLKDYSVVGLEALIRWQHPDHQLIYPADFIEIAEKTGLIIEIGKWVLETACQQIAKWRSAGLNVLPIAINVSPLELKDKGYFHNFLKTLKRNQISPEYIEIEITENAFIEDKEIVIENLRQLFSRRVNILLDDFGKGFSSLDHIRSLPISALKIDRSFVQDIHNHHNENPIISSTIILAQKLKMTVIAEGIETKDQLINLKIAGCDQVQGYFFSRPVPENEIQEFILSPIRSIAI